METVPFMMLEDILDDEGFRNHAAMEKVYPSIFSKYVIRHGLGDLLKEGLHVYLDSPENMHNLTVAQLVNLDLSGSTIMVSYHPHTTRGRGSVQFPWSLMQWLMPHNMTVEAATNGAVLGFVFKPDDRVPMNRVNVGAPLNVCARIIQNYVMRIATRMAPAPILGASHVD